jgi:sugar phosphate isomerase/epimerase
MGYKRGPEPGDWQARAVEIFVRLAQIAAGADKVLVFENPPGGDAAVGSAAECLSALQAVDSPHFRLNLDPGNFGARGDDPLQAFEMLRGFVGNVHVKDIRTAGDTSTYCVAGEGICNYPETFRGLREDGYSGFVTAEPHLSHAQSYHTSGREGFSHAARTMIELLESAGYKLIKAPE